MSLPPMVLNKISEKMCFKLANVQIQQHNQVGRTRWKGAVELQLEGDDVECWNNYINPLDLNFISLDEDTQDKLIWTRNVIDGYCTTKKGYEMAILEQYEGEKSWWWQGLWDSNILLKTILTF